MSTINRFLDLLERNTLVRDALLSLPILVWFLFGFILGTVSVMCAVFLVVLSKRREKFDANIALLLLPIVMLSVVACITNLFADVAKHNNAYPIVAYAETVYTDFVQHPSVDAGLRVLSVTQSAAGIVDLQWNPQQQLNDMLLGGICGSNSRNLNTALPREIQKCLQTMSQNVVLLSHGKIAQPVDLSVLRVLPPKHVSYNGVVGALCAAVNIIMLIGVTVLIDKAKKNMRPVTSLV